MPPEVFLSHMYNWISQFKISCTKAWWRNSFW